LHFQSLMAVSSWTTWPGEEAAGLF
jgi:hypothetical protein